MKKLYLIASLFFIVACGSHDTLECVAEKALESISRGEKTELLHGALVVNAQAEAFIKNDHIPTRWELHKQYFQIGDLFYRWDLIDIKKCEVALYHISDFTFDKGGKYDGLLYREYLNLYKKEGGEYNGRILVKITDIAAAILEYKDVPLYELRYKIDSHHVEFVGNEYRIATISVIKHPESGYRVVSFVWEK